MHKFTRSFARIAFVRPPLRPVQRSLLSCQPRWLTTTTNLPPQQPPNKDQEHVETIDPQDYPELYPSEEEPVDTEWFVEDQEDKEFVPLWQRRAVDDHLNGRWAMQEASKRLIDSGDLSPENIRDLLDENKMDAIQVLDVRGRCDWTDYMIVAESDKGDRFLTNVAEQIRQTVNKVIREHPSAKEEYAAPHIEGKDDQSGWVLIDLGSCVVHLFTPEVRKHYNLEALWIPSNEAEE
ncbi:Oligomerization domain-containing protein [Fennellomyces sp. T-0311]|nr:Oligomerization domain-containing protein [Fennellomyces sp. T-0311]